MKSKGIILFILLLIMFALIGVLIIQIYDLTQIQKQKIGIITEQVELKQQEQQQKQIQIYNGKRRPIAVMLDNVGEARPQAGLNDAYMIYEIIVEGNLTRLMALYKEVDLEKIGPIRSARHYFLDYALENDAIYVHFGWSPQAKSDISSLNVDNINGIAESSISFWRVRDKSAPHNVATSTEEILDIAERKEYNLKSTSTSVLNYVPEEVELENGVLAEEITIPYSATYKVKYKYDEESKKYIRSYNNTTQKDWDTKEIVTTKNIIITFAKNTSLNDGTNKGRQDLSNIGLLDGYYITNGKAIKITCYKTSRRSKTIYRDLDGNEIKVNDGNTFVQIVPIKSKVLIEPGENENLNNEIENKNAIN